MIQRVKQVLSGSTASVICFLLAWIFKIVLFAIFLDFGSDKLGQVVIAKNFLKGNGLTIGQVFTDNLAQQVYAPAIYNPPIGWPPGYSILLSPFLIVTKSFPIACMLLDLVAALIFLFYLRRLLKFLKFENALTNLFLLFQGLFIFTSGPSDFLAMTFMLVGMYHLLKILNTDSFSGADKFLAIFGFIGAAMLRYLYQPVCLLLLAVCVIYTVVRGQGSKARSVLIPLVIIVLLVSLGWYIFQRDYDLRAVYLAPSEKGFYPENIVFMFPFIFASLLNVNFYTIQLATVLHQTYAGISGIFRLMNVILLGISLLVYSRFIKNHWRNFRDQYLAWFLFGFIFICIVGGLILLSLIHSPKVGPPLFYWTYVTPSRYYVLPMLIIQIFVWYWLFVRKPAAYNILLRFLQVIFAFLICIEILHGIYFISKKLNQRTIPFSAVVPSTQEDAELVKYISEHDWKSSGLVVTSFLKRFQFIAQLNGASALFNPIDLNLQNLRSTKPVKVLLILKSAEEPYLSSFLQRPDVQLRKVVGEYYFFEYDVP